MNFKKPLYLILGSGGARGFAHIGALQALEERNIKPDVILGCSMGAVVGAFFAAGIPTSRMIELADDHQGTNALRRLVDPAFPIRGLMRGKRVARFLHKHLPYENIEDLPTPWLGTALDIQSGRMAIFEQGSLVRAIMSSVSIPGVFPPQEHKNSWFVDGGVIAPVPTKVAIDRGAGSIIAVDVGPWVGDENDSVIIKGFPKEGYDAQVDENNENDIPGEGSILSLWMSPLVGNADKTESGVWERLMGSARSTGERMMDQFRQWRLEQQMNSAPYIGQTLLRSMMIMQREMGEMHLNLYPPTVLIRPELRGVRAFNFDKTKECIDIGRAAAEEAFDKIE